LKAEIIDLTPESRVTIKFTIDISIVGKTFAEIDNSVLQLTVLADTLTTNQKYISRWHVISQSGDTMVLLVKFKFPECICMNQSTDKLSIVFLNPSPFQTAKGTILPQGYTLIGQLPPQVEVDDAD